MKQSSKILPFILVSPSMILMTMVVIIPIFSTIMDSFTTDSGLFTLDNYMFFFQSEEAFNSLVFTLTAALSIVVLAIGFSFLIAMYLRFSNSWISSLIGRLYLLPRFIPGIVAVYAVMNMIKDAGFIHRILLQMGFEYYPGLLYDLKGVILSNLWFNIPFATMLISASLSNVSDSYIESLQDVGGNWFNILKDIIWPLIYKDVIVAATFILMGQIGAFTIPYLTGPNNPKMLGVLLYQQVNVYLDYNRAAALSVLMFLISLVGAFVYIQSNLKEEVWQGES